MVLRGLAAGHELEHYGDGQLVQLAAQLVEGLAALVVQRLERSLPLLSVALRVEDDPGEQLSGLDLRIFAVLEHLNPLDRGIGEAGANLPVELLPDALKLRLVHDEPSRVSRVISVTRGSKAINEISGAAEGPPDKGRTPCPAFPGHRPQNFPASTSPRCQGTRKNPRGGFLNIRVKDIEAVYTQWSASPGFSRGFGAERRA